MSLRDALTAVLLGALGIAAAVAIAVFANRITGEEIGLASEPVSIISADSRVRPDPAPGPREDRGDEVEASEDSGGELEAGDDNGGGSGRVAVTMAAAQMTRGPEGTRSRPTTSQTTTARAMTTPEAGRPGAARSGSGSSGSGSSGSGSSGSGSSGSGGDEPEKPEDD